MTKKSKGETNTGAPLRRALTIREGGPTRRGGEGGNGKDTEQKEGVGAGTTDGGAKA